MDFSLLADNFIEGIITKHSRLNTVVRIFYYVTKFLYVVARKIKRTFSPIMTRILQQGAKYHEKSQRSPTNVNEVTDESGNKLICPVQRKMRYLDTVLSVNDFWLSFELLLV